MRLGTGHCSDHLTDHSIAVQLATKFVPYHMVRRRYGNVQVPYTGRDRPGHIGNQSSAPALQNELAQSPYLLQLQIGAHVVLLDFGVRKGELRLVYPHLAQIHVHHSLLQFGQVNPRGLHRIPVGDIDKIDPGHGNPRLVLIEAL